MNAETNYALAGLFVLTMAATLVAGILWLGGSGPGTDYKTYLVYTRDSVAGLSRDVVVKYRGVDVGRVHGISIDPGNPERVRLLLEIENGTPVKQDTVATLEARGLTGLAYVNLAGGSNSAPLLEAEPGAAYPVIASKSSTWGQLDRKVGVLLDNLIETSNDLKQWLSSDNRQLLLRTLTSLETLSAALAGRSASIDSALGDLEQTLRNSRDASARLPALIDGLQRSAAALERMADEIGRAGTLVREVVRARDRDLQRFTGDALPEAAATISELHQSAVNFRRFSEALQRDPGVLLRGGTTAPPGPGE